LSYNVLFSFQVKVSVEEKDIRGNHILVVEDIFDSGTTIMKTKQVLEGFGPASLKIATLFHKKNPKNLVHNYFADYIGFIVPDVFIIGFGMDYN
jgi:hypoxanthine phosphoribosyltransferase